MIWSWINTDPPKVKRVQSVDDLYREYQFILCVDTRLLSQYKESSVMFNQIDDWAKNNNIEWIMDTALYDENMKKWYSNCFSENHIFMATNDPESFVMACLRWS